MAVDWPTCWNCRNGRCEDCSLLGCHCTHGEDEDE